MKETYPINLKSVVLVLSVLVFGACKNSKKAPPFPELSSEYVQPQTKQFEFSKTDTIQWVTEEKSKIKPLPTKHFSWDKLPSTPFNIDITYKLKAHLATKQLEWNNLPKTNFSLDSLTKAEIIIKVTKLGSPKIVKEGNNMNIPNASRGIMEFNTDFGLPGTPGCVATDNKCMIWIGTDGGIAKYVSQYL